MKVVAFWLLMTTAFGGAAFAAFHSSFEFMVLGLMAAISLLGLITSVEGVAERNAFRSRRRLQPLRVAQRYIEK